MNVTAKSFCVAHAIKNGVLVASTPLILVPNMDRSSVVYGVTLYYPGAIHTHVGTFSYATYTRLTHWLTKLLSDSNSSHDGRNT